jgi:hypothetical protein
LEDLVPSFKEFFSSDAMRDYLQECVAQYPEKKSVEVDYSDLQKDKTAIADLLLKNPDAVVAIARCGNRVAVADPGAWFLDGDVRELIAYLYTDRPVYRPGHTVNIKGVLRWRVRAAGTVPPPADWRSGPRTAGGTVPPHR